MTTQTKKQQTEQQEALEKLRQMFKGRDRATVYTILRHVSASGASRDMSLVTVDDDGTLRDITWLACHAMGDKPKDRHGRWVIRAVGGGMDMGMHVVWNLSYCLYRDEGMERAGYVLRHEWA